MPEIPEIKEPPGEIDMTPQQVKRLRNEIAAHSFEKVDDPEVPGEWYRDGSNNNILIQKVEGKKNYEVEFDRETTPLVEDALRP